MSLNSSPLNSAPLNGFVFAGEDGSGALISLEQYVALIETGSLVEVEQSVYPMGSGALIYIQQDVGLQLSGSGALINVAQSIGSSGSGVFIGIGQQVVNDAQLTFFDKNGWDLIVSLAGFNLPRNIIQEVSVVHAIKDDSRAEIKLNPKAGVYNLYSYQGKELVIYARTGSSFVRIFTGIVDIPRVEVVNEKIILEGVASRETLIRNYLTPYVDDIGYYSETVFGPRNNVFQEVNDRMSTIPYDLDFDPNGNWSVTSWTPKASPDITLSNNHLYREQQPEVRIESAREVVNKVGITLTYAYQRLHNASLSYTWNAGLEACEFLTKGNTLPTREMVRSAASSAGWKLSAIGFTNLWRSGFYRCGGATIGWVNNTQNLTVSNSNLTASGSNYSTSQSTGESDINAVLCLGASWTCKRRFTQNVQENYTMYVNSPQSQALYGIREKNETLSLQADFDPTQWEDPALYDREFSGTRIAQSATNYYINMDTQSAEYNNGVTTALNKAKTDILSSHRDTEISFITFINPNYQLRHTIGLSTTRINSKGKVRGITHKFTADGNATSTVRLALYRSIGSTTETALVPLSRPSYATPASMGGASLQSRWGRDPSSLEARSWTGYVGNKWVTVGGGFNSNTYKTTYQESFIVDTPPVPANRRDQQSYTRSGSYNISIPTDTLTITFVDS